MSSSIVMEVVECSATIEWDQLHGAERDVITAFNIQTSYHQNHGPQNDKNLNININLRMLHKFKTKR